MNLRNTRVVAMAAGVTGLLAALSLRGETPKQPSSEPGKAKPAAERVSVDEARRHAKLMHEIYSNTLVVTHHHYFRGDRGTVPARAIEDVFEQIEKDSGTRARWIAVNTPAMGARHEPEGSFEKKAAGEIAAGKADYERVEDGYYRRATAIPLRAGCIGCHTKTSGASAKPPLFAGLVISVPVKEK